MPRTDLRGCRLLIVEDEAIVAMLVEDMLLDLGCVVVDIAGSVEKAMGIATRGETQIDGAVLDVNIGGTKVFPVADALADRGIPFVFATGYGVAGLEGRFPDRVTIAKPFGQAVLERALLSML